ncbi:S8 family serine peptidase [Fluviispira sanaruensis]|uniref:Peptidase S8 n=1 Tax=Fluviispira sanaruensis TaxID=2493639 RepID=A0A4P2VMF6_FLUSA|nr:S8 family serine peptidase [Fluviispira sanaruensis]BBH53214.1 peptidase S8 [Fluviispira sanaruensis]
MFKFKEISLFFIACFLIAGCGDIFEKNKTPSYIPPAQKQPLIISSLFEQQWYLKNTGQTMLNFRVAKTGYDINITLPNTITGNNVKVLVADSGVDFNHPNLQDSILANSSIDFLKNPAAENINPVIQIGKTEKDTESNHGTNVAGIIAARPLANSFTGIAPKAKIGSANIVSDLENKNKVSLFDQRIKLYDYALKKKFNFINESFGSSGLFYYNDSDRREKYIINNKIKDNYKIANNPDGFIIVKSGGNSTCDSEKALNSKNIDEDLIYNGIATLTEQQKLYYKSLRPVMSQVDLISSNPYTITIANAMSHGIINRSSSIGANLWITAFGGNNQSAQKNDHLLSAVPKTDVYEQKYLPAIFTTRIHNNPFDYDSIFETRALPDEMKNNYTISFSGTSAAAPMVSGVIALILETNPNLSLRDVKYILAKTANYSKVSSFQPKPYCIKILEEMAHFNNNFKDFWDEDQWIVNHSAEKFHYNNYYGFGLIDANKALEEARKTEYPKFIGRAEEYIVDQVFNEVIEPNKSKVFEIKVNKNFKIESIQVTPVLDTFQSDGIGIKIESPLHTKNIL